ncbi:hypothetical protein F0562_018166 [Nyssa sinensis]|uniref:40S ribosomal protein S7 n=1 Tax=Nyssa sinensis TaxID=561372 RepID=A0A5J4ZCF4_9ASTE|nr:hypothetical protein F0562_018166 [Nyssa sinensis]
MKTMTMMNLIIHQMLPHMREQHIDKLSIIQNNSSGKESNKWVVFNTSTDYLLYELLAYFLNLKYQYRSGIGENPTYLLAVDVQCNTLYLEDSRAAQFGNEVIIFRDAKLSFGHKTTIASRATMASVFAFTVRSVKMYTSRKKIHKDKDAEPTEFEESVAQALFDLENTNQELKSDLKDLYINSAAQIDVSGNRKAVVIHVPYRLRKAFRKIHVRLVRELEKKFSGKDVILIATRRILRPPKKGSAVQRPRSRTLTAVHDAMLEDVVVPAEIVGKRVRYRIDGSKIIKIFLDPKERNNTEYKLETFTAVYRKLSGKDVVFEYPATEA